MGSVLFGTAATGSSGGSDSRGDGLAPDAQKANIFDPSAIKAVLDLATVQALRKTYEEDHTHSNLKLAIGFLACLVGIAAYVYPISFPDNKQFLKWCVILYFAFSSLIQAISTVFFRDVIFVTQAKSFPSEKDHFYIRVISKLPRYETKYSLIFTAILNDKPHGFERSFDIQKYFDAEGYFYEKRYGSEVENFVRDTVKNAGKKKAQ
mmetsp:Transcript_25213/g.42230  ORF Transcript_25213/g.42230 Transcript_25213/m.42230 type:complete len:207 (+) Transcript_25213:119-739(+)